MTTERVMTMHHSLKLSLGKQPQDGVVAFRQIPVRERLLRYLLGDRNRVLVLVPGDSVRELAITDIGEGGADGEQN